MKTPEEYAAVAEGWLDAADHREQDGAIPEYVSNALAYAQVYATLAQASATQGPKIKLPEPAWGPKT